VSLSARPLDGGARAKHGSHTVRGGAHSERRLQSLPAHVDVLVIGAGIAGLATARALLARGRAPVVVEARATPFQRGSGQNAAVFRHAERDPALVRMVRESAELFGDLCGARPFKDTRGALYLAADEGILAPFARGLAEGGVRRAILDDGAVRARVTLADSRALHGLLVEDDGVMDLALVERALIAALGSAPLVCGRRVVSLAPGSPVSVGFDDGARVSADAVVVATGASSEELAPVPCAPVKRHLAVVEGTPDAASSWPIVWRLDHEVYLRPSSGVTLSSACEEIACAPDDERVDEGAADAVIARLRTLIDGEPTVRDVWACLRAWAPDRRPIAGAVPAMPGVFVVGALGGCGMSLGMAVADRAARAVVDGTEEPLLAPGRFS